MEWGGVKRGLLCIGFGNTGFIDKKTHPSILTINGILNIEGKAIFGVGSHLIIGETGIMTLGDNFSNTATGTFICVNRIHIGRNTAVAWDAMIMDTDWHSTMNTKTQELSAASGVIYIANNCWICTRSIVLKNTMIPDGCILAANSTISKKFENTNTLLAGCPAKEVRFNITKSTCGDFHFLNQYEK